ncbi:MAG: HNH endonuclease [Flavobacterium nitrogenifigens]|uniref:HNH endonuclease n=1 Tax=Flavobacterium nitrogenifigens TaxID=1617283 RepID=UPI002808D955|nr:HNH endonuclease [Flavobacterium nitrogenifigens]MDQ8012110.1 HNH endonuclease [Flavobacterium nitrogenifigens]
MKNLSPFIDDTNTFFDNVLKAKRKSQKDETYKDRIELLKPSIRVNYKNFDDNFSDKSLATLSAHGYLDQEKDDLLKMYKYDNNIFQKLKTDVTTTKTNRIINTCQNCTINEINSFDHIVPKDEFPEYAVNPKNLFPSCTKCNGHKSTVWRSSGESVFLNLYLDSLPQVQYLFCKPIIENELVTVSFVVENVKGIDNNLFKLISTHYSRLELPQRFRENSHDTIYELSKEIKKYKDKVPRGELIQTIKDSIVEDKDYYGFNFWKSIIKEALIENEEYLELVYK